MAAGYWGKILEIDLSSESTRTIEFGPELQRKFLGGRGIIAWYLWNHTQRGLDPNGTDNPFIIAPGPFNGTALPAPRSCMGFKSPHTGLIAYIRSGGPSPVCTNAKRAGWDAIVIKGKASKLSVLYVKDDSVDIIPADDLKGASILQTLIEARKKVDDERASILAVGPAGENRVPYSNVVDTSLEAFAGRLGGGAVLAAKNLKAVAVRGTGEVEVADPKAVKQYAFDLLKLLNANPGQNKRWGTNYWTYASSHRYSDAPSWNFREGWNDYSAIEICGWPQEVRGHFIRKSSCNQCPLHCKHVSSVVGEDPEVLAPMEYESAMLLGTDLDMRDLKAFIRMVSLADDLGIDSISVGNTLAFLTECIERGYLSPNDLGGVNFTWGDGETYARAIAWVALRDGPNTAFGLKLGDLIAKGVKYIAEQIERKKGIKDQWKIAYQAKGNEIAGHHPRNKLPQYHGYWAGFTYITGNRGGCHLEGSECWRLYAEKEKDPWPSRSQDTKAVIDSLVTCFFVYRSKALTTKLMTDVLNAVTGWGFETYDTLVLGERIFNLEACYNIREAGISRKEVKLPDREFEEPLKLGPNEGFVFDRNQYEAWLDEYFEYRGWDKQTGRPTKQKLDDLGLSDVAQQLSSLGLLP